MTGSNNSNILTKASVWVAAAIGRHLPDPTKEMGALALQGAIIFDVVWTVLTLLISGVGIAILNFVIVTAILVLGMFAGVAVFAMNNSNDPNNGTGTSPRI